MEFRLEVIDDWPPVSAESLWVEPIGDGKFRIDNSPFFVRNIAVGDLVEGAEVLDEPVKFVGKISSGGHSTVWVITLNDKIGESLKGGIRELGCHVEGSPWPSLISIDVPSGSHLGELHRLLREVASTGQIEFVDACVVE